MAKTEYEITANEFCARNGIVIKAVFKGNVPPEWSHDKFHGNRYLVTISRQTSGLNSIQFYYWGSYNDKINAKHPTNYDILSCCSSEIGYDQYTDGELMEELGVSCKNAKATIKHAEKLNGFFTKNEREELVEIN